MYDNTWEPEAKLASLAMSSLSDGDIELAATPGASSIGNAVIDACEDAQAAALDLCTLAAPGSENAQARFNITQPTFDTIRTKML